MKIKTSNKVKRKVIFVLLGSILVLGILAAGCTQKAPQKRATTTTTTPPASNVTKPVNKSVTKPVTKPVSEIPSAYAGKTNPYLGNQNAIAAGKKIYLASCVGCHGKTGATQPEADFSSAGWWSSKTDAYLLWKVSDGVTAEGMPSWNSTYKEDEIWDVLAYSKTLSK